MDQDSPADCALAPTLGDAASEERLTGRNSTETVARIDRTVRKPWTAATPSVHRLLAALRERGVDAPEPLGRDAEERQVLEYAPGPTADSILLDTGGLARVGGMVHAAADLPTTDDDRWDDLLPPRGGGELICHHDLAPWNLVTGDRWVFIDWDGAGPSTPLWDLPYAASAFTLNDPSLDPATASPRLAAFIDGYDATGDLRAELPSAMVARTRAMLTMLARSRATGVEPWGSMFADGHGAHWAAVTAYIDRNRDTWARALGVTAPRRSRP